MEKNRFPLHYHRRLGDEDVKGPLRSKWRIVHLLGNPIVLNWLRQLGKPGLTFSEFRYFLCDDVPKRVQIQSELEQLKTHLSDEPALEFHLPPYSTTSQLAKDLKALKQDGILVRDTNSWCLNMRRYNNLIYEWEQHQDLQMIRDYNGGDLTRFGRYVRVYGIPRTLISDDERGELESISHSILGLVRRAYEVEHSAKVRAWHVVQSTLSSSEVPASIASRLLNNFTTTVISPVLSSRSHYDDTPGFILFQMLNAKQDELMMKRIGRKVSEKVSFESQKSLMDKYVRPPVLPKKRTLDKDEFEFPEYLEEPDFEDENEKEIYRTLLDYLNADDSEVDKALKDLLEFQDLGIDERTLRLIRDLRISILHGVTFVVSTPVVPINENPLYFITEKEFLKG